jgi:N-methylhydantoinase A
MKQEARTHFGTVAADKVITYATSIDARYRGQEHGVVCSIAEGETTDDVTANFHEVHRQAYTFRLDTTAIEITGLHLEAVLETKTIQLKLLDAHARTLSVTPKGSRPLWVSGTGWINCPVYDRERLPPLIPIAGPALIEEPTTTTMVLQNQRVERMDSDLLIISENTEGT